MYTGIGSVDVFVSEVLVWSLVGSWLSWQSITYCCIEVVKIVLEAFEFI